MTAFTAHSGKDVATPHISPWNLHWQTHGDSSMLELPTYHNPNAYHLEAMHAGRLANHASRAAHSPVRTLGGLIADVLDG